MRNDDSRVTQFKLKTARDLRHHIKVHGLTHHIVHDCETDWWWFADDRNRLLEAVFNSGRQVVITPQDNPTDDTDYCWAIQSDLIDQVKDFCFSTTFLTPNMGEDMLTDLFWTAFTNQKPERFAYWDMDNPENGFEEYLFYREMRETGAHLTSADE